MAIFIEVAKNAQQKIKNTAIKTRCLMSKKCWSKTSLTPSFSCIALLLLLVNFSLLFCFYFMPSINSAIFSVFCIALLMLLTSFVSVFWSGCDDIYQMRTQKLQKCTNLLQNVRGTIGRHSKKRAHSMWRHLSQF